MRTKAWTMVLVVSGLCAACGETVQEQALVGAGAGAATAVVLDGRPFTGAVIGAAGNLIYCQTHPGKCK